MLDRRVYRYRPALTVGAVADGHPVDAVLNVLDLRQQAEALITLEVGQRGRQVDPRNLVCRVWVEQPELFVSLDRQPESW